MAHACNAWPALDVIRNRLADLIARRQGDKVARRIHIRPKPENLDNSWASNKPICRFNHGLKVRPCIEPEFMDRIESPKLID